MGLRLDTNQATTETHRYMATEKKVGSQTGSNKLQMAPLPKGPIEQHARASKAGKPFTGAPNHNLPR